MDRTGKIILVVSVLAMLGGMPLAMKLGLIKMSPPVEDENATRPIRSRKRDQHVGH